MHRLRLHWIGVVALVGTVVMGASLAGSVPVAHHATPAAELRVLVEGDAVRIRSAAYLTLDVGLTPPLQGYRVPATARP